MSILIDLNSIKKNKDVGSTHTLLRGVRTVTFEAAELPEYLTDGKDCHITQWMQDDVGNKTYVSGVLNGVIDTDLFEKLQKDCLSVTVEEDVADVQHMAEPKYKYSYLDTKVECNECNSLVWHKDIQEACDDDGYESDLCPLCSAWGSFELKYEGIDEALKRKERV